MSTSRKWVAGGSMMEAIGAIATIALAIVGLTGIWPAILASVATIVTGAAFLIEGGSFGASTVASSSNLGGVSTVNTESNAGVSSAFLGGVAGIVLGILALLNVVAPTLLAVSLIVFGATFFLTMLATGDGFSSGAQIMGGLAALVLGILAVCGVAQMSLILVGLLCVGGAGLFAGSALGMRAMSKQQQY
ncbi:MAG TPA: hypothetical protein VG167_05715 [Verrucomicrobiae bacterium]|nr:hypothetical protein [Verrucomicrobiae bacterium]